MQFLRKFITEFVSTEVASTNLKAILRISINMQSQLSTEHSTSGIQEDRAVTIQFCDKTIRVPATIFKLLQNYLVLEGLKYRKNPANKKLCIIWLIALSQLAKTEFIQCNSWNLCNLSQFVAPLVFKMNALFQFISL